MINYKRQQRLEVIKVVNQVTDILQIKYPIIQGGMGDISDSELSIAVSEAGGLGTIGAGTLPVSELKKKLETVKNNTNKPYSVNIPINVTPYLKELVQFVIDFRVPVVSLSAGNPAKIIPYLKEHDITIICVSSTVRQAKKAEESGADLIVCEGYEAAGINAPNESTTMTLIPQIVKNVSVPVIAAGGIGDGKGMAAALSLGASGVQMGTRFVATKEARFHEKYKQTIMESNDESTIIVGRKFKKTRRILKTPYAEKLINLEATNNSDEFIEKTTETYHKLGAVDGDLDNGFINGGQISGLIDDCPTVNELLETMMNEAKETLNNSLKLL